jgi:UDP-glucose 4-epimerase
MNILVTGGAGYIGSHTCLELLAEGHDVVVVDNFANSSEISLERVMELAGRTLMYYRVDLRDRTGLEAVFDRHRIDAVIHFAGLKAVGESVEFPLSYYSNNVYGSLVLLEMMASKGVKKMVFSSSATVYGEPERVPLTEDCGLKPANPYGRSKLTVEEMLRDLAHADGEWSICILRYFNPVGAHPSGFIGEAPQGAPNNLFPYVCQVAVGRRPYLRVFGNDYPTCDGTGVRDYIHVVDLASGHLRALDMLENAGGAAAYNLGTGTGYSVLEVVSVFEQVSGKNIPCRVFARRAGDVAASYADPSLAERDLGWKALRGLDVMCKDAWRWQSANPDGYQQ